MQSIGCCFDTGTTSFPLAASLTISVTFLKSGNAIVDSLEYTKVPLTDTSNVPVNKEQWIPVRLSMSADCWHMIFRAVKVEQPAARQTYTFGVWEVLDTFNLWSLVKMNNDFWDLVNFTCTVKFGKYNGIYAYCIGKRHVLESWKWEQWRNSGVLAPLSPLLFQF